MRHLAHCMPVMSHKSLSPSLKVVNHRAKNAYSLSQSYTHTHFSPLHTCYFLMVTNYANEELKHHKVQPGRDFQANT